MVTARGNAAIVVWYNGFIVRGLEWFSKASIVRGVLNRYKYVFNGLDRDINDPDYCDTLRAQLLTSCLACTQNRLITLDIQT